MENDNLQEELEQEELQRKEVVGKDLKTPKGNISQLTNFLPKGQYIKVTVWLPYRHIKLFRPELPLMLCRVNAGEDNLGFLKLRFKRHRWYGNVMKSNDPIIMSSGWRRYQTIPVFCT